MTSLMGRPKPPERIAAGLVWACSMASGLIWAIALCVMAQAALVQAPATDPALPSPGFVVSTRRSNPHRAVRESKNAYQGPIVDIHAHTQ